jgi:TPP-dependent pyruvate/acetoin dehydrogenase alpha subunit
LNNQINELKKR